MDAFPLLLLVGLVIVCALFVAVKRRERAIARDVLTQPVEPKALDAVVGKVGQGRKVQAIQELRQTTGLGLSEAKALVEAIQRGHRPPPPSNPQR